MYVMYTLLLPISIYPKNMPTKANLPKIVPRTDFAEISVEFFPPLCYLFMCVFSLFLSHSSIHPSSCAVFIFLSEDKKIILAAFAFVIPFTDCIAIRHGKKKNEGQSSVNVDFPPK